MDKKTNKSVDMFVAIIMAQYWLILLYISLYFSKMIIYPKGK